MTTMKPEQNKDMEAAEKYSEDAWLDPNSNTYEPTGYANYRCLLEAGFIAGIQHARSQPSDISSKIQETVNQVVNNRASIKEDFAKAYLAETGLSPSECELCEQHHSDKVTWWFRKREQQPSERELKLVEALRKIAAFEDCGDTSYETDIAREVLALYPEVK
jgi:hypothetical protein